MLREAVTFERKTRTADGSGGFTEDWAAISGAPVRAMVKAKSGKERWQSQRVEATSQWLLVCRYWDGLGEGDRVTFRGRAYNIKFINNVKLADRWLEIDLSGGVAT